MLPLLLIADDEVYSIRLCTKATLRKPRASPLTLNPNKGSGVSSVRLRCLPLARRADTLPSTSSGALRPPPPAPPQPRPPRCHAGGPRWGQEDGPLCRQPLRAASPGPAPRATAATSTTRPRARAGDCALPASSLTPEPGDGASGRDGGPGIAPSLPPGTNPEQRATRPGSRRDGDHEAGPATGLRRAQGAAQAGGRRAGEREAEAARAHGTGWAGGPRGPSKPTAYAGETRPSGRGLKHEEGREGPVPAPRSQAGASGSAGRRAEPSGRRRHPGRALLRHSAGSVGTRLLHCPASLW